MLYQPSPAHAPDPPLANGGEKMTPTRKRIRELAERTSNGTRMRLLWLQGTRELWVEVCEPALDVTIVIPAEPEQALDTFHHPYAYAAAHKKPASKTWRCAANRDLDGDRE
jgi:hypothetical protein